jgi:starvation-inducible DNA-binding protein
MGSLPCDRRGLPVQAQRTIGERRTYDATQHRPFLRATPRRNEILTDLLADEYVLYTKTRNHYWNTVGPQFNDLHEFFEKQYQELNGEVDDIAERIRALGGPVVGTLAEFVERTRLKEHPGHYPETQAMLTDLLADYEPLIRQLHVDLETCAEEYHDMGTNDFLIGLMERHEKMAWMLRSFLDGKSV